MTKECKQCNQSFNGENELCNFCTNTNYKSLDKKVRLVSTVEVLAMLKDKKEK